jgi:hypothetical protein
LDSIEKIGFTAAVPSDDDIMLRTEGLNFALVPEATEAGNDNLFNMHLAICGNSEEVFLKRIMR